MSPVNLRVIGLGAAVTVAVLLPLVATAGPTGDPVRPAERADAKAGDLLPGLGLGPRTPSSPPAATAPAAPPPEAPAAASPAPDAAARVTPAPVSPERVSRCGPELASPDGVEAQTCVLAEGRDTWARTYYRNATGRELDAFLTLMAPGGRTVQVRCRVPAQDEPGTCETPGERGRGVATAYTAVAEFAGTGEGDSTPLLLRAGSNTAEREGS
ncbi:MULTISPECIES: hypothetical protein [Streptomyces]|uniref:hypothetical protein n=1 Tax=Streptomyces TaxID=1883 RepID=UPI001C8B94F0|nr:hypothetical protein [Streptomyces lateritius]MBX9424040.1 hypothetical protein [Streptomyces lateritius]